MTLSIRFAALVLSSSLFSAGVARANGASQTAQQAAQQAQKASGPTSASGKLAVAQPRLRATSWNGRRITVVTPSPANTRFPTRGLDPMNVQLHNVQPDSEMEFLRQQQSHDVAISGNHSDEQMLKREASKAAKYVTMFKFKATPPSSAQAHNELITDEKKVAWPNSRVLVRGVTRDGQKIPHVTGVVEGVRDQRIMPYDAATDQVVHEQISGRLLPSARAWIKAGNLFVSEPTENPAQVAEGQKLLKSATDKEALAQKRQAEAQAALSTDRNKYYQLNAEVSRLTQEASTERTQGDQLVALGKKIMVRVVSAAALPASAPATTVNVRVRGENVSGSIHTASTTTDAYDGYTAHAVEALHRDHLETTVEFAPQTGAALSSRATLKFQVPDQQAKAAFVLNGIKYYKVQPNSIERNHDPVASN